MNNIVYQKDIISNLLEQKAILLKKYEDINDTENKNDIFKKMNQLLPSAKHLTMIHIKKCDFCDNSADDNTLHSQITINYGFQICELCYDENKHYTSIIYNYITNKQLSWQFLWSCIPQYMDNVPRFGKHLKIKVRRSDGTIEDGWESCGYSLINCKNYIFPVVNNKDSLTKGIYMEELCECNPEYSYNLIKNTIDHIMEPL